MNPSSKDDTDANLLARLTIQAARHELISISLGVSSERSGILLRFTQYILPDLRRFLNIEQKDGVFVVKRRYSSFLNLHTYLLSRFPLLALPILPPKAVEADIEERRQALTRYVVKLLTDNNLKKDEVVKTFLTQQGDWDVWFASHPRRQPPFKLFQSEETQHTELPRNLSNELQESKRLIPARLESLKTLLRVYAHRNPFEAGAGAAFHVQRDQYDSLSIVANPALKLDPSCKLGASLSAPLQQLLLEGVDIRNGISVLMDDTLSYMDVLERYFSLDNRSQAKIEKLQYQISKLHSSAISDHKSLDNAAASKLSAATSVLTTKLFEEMESMVSSKSLIWYAHEYLRIWNGTETDLATKLRRWLENISNLIRPSSDEIRLDLLSFVPSGNPQVQGLEDKMPLYGPRCVRDDYQDILEDPFFVLKGHDSEVEPRIREFVNVLSDGITGNTDPIALRALAWWGIPSNLRALAWGIFLQILPAERSGRSDIIQGRRQYYAQSIKEAFSQDLQRDCHNQLLKDLPRLARNITLWSCQTTQKSLERILYLWSNEHPDSGYVQGIDDLATPLFLASLCLYLKTEVDPEDFDTVHLPSAVLQAIESDVYHALTSLLHAMPDHYTPGQVGIMRGVRNQVCMTRKVNKNLADHLKSEGVEPTMYAFRWWNCLLMREMDRARVVRLWDTYFAEGIENFASFHLYVCTAFLERWSTQLLAMEFQEIVIFLQMPPTTSWTDHDIELLLSEASMLQTVSNRFLSSDANECDSS